MSSLSPAIAPPPETSALATLVVDSNLIALALTDHDRVLFANAAFGRLFGRPGELVGVPIVDLLVPEYREPVYAALQAPDGPPPVCVAKAFRGASETFDVELRFERVMRGNHSLLALFAEDVTDRFRAAAQLNLLAFSDPLTGLANRAMFADRLRQAALTTRRVGQGFAVVMLDLDRFKPINDQHGHEAGDLVLQRVASRLLACLRDTDTVARLGGDEFGVLLSSVSARTDANTVAHRLISVASRPIDLGLSEVAVGASAGVAIYPEHALTVDHLLAAADAALYAAKRQGRGCVAWACAASPAELAPAPLIWNVAHEVGVREIDEQHATLAALLNELSAALRNGREHAAMFREIIRYTGFHFATEERLMRSCGYDEEPAHRDMHRRLLDDLRSLRLEECEGASVSLTLRYLQEWLLRHVDGADRDLAAALRATGVI
jgi:diguanylate cyclase (GGDEF)-like protein/hemerythrin-like metal-binding protein/PAS domain S-box-containing protein